MRPETARLEEHVLLISSSVGWWRGIYQLPKDKVSVKVDGVTVNDKDKGITTPRALVMNDDWPCRSDGTAWKSVFTKMDSRREAILTKYAVSSPITGVRIVPRTATPEFYREMLGPADDQGNPQYDPDAEEQSLAFLLSEAADAFVADLPNILEQIRQNTNTQVWHAIVGKIPTSKTEMREKFYIDVIPIELAGGSDRNPDMADMIVNQEVIKNTLKRKIDQAVENMIAEPREQLAHALKDLQDLIARDGRVNSRSFNPVREAISKIRLFEFVANDELLEQINTLEQRIGNTVASSLDSAAAASSGFSAALQSVMTSVTDAQVQASDLQRFGEELRGVDI